MGGGGQRLNRYDWMANERTQAQHNRILNEAMDAKYPSHSVFHMTNLQTIRYPSGYQVMFWRPEQAYSVDDYARVINDFLYYASNHETDITKDDDGTKVSFHISSKRTALRLARKYGQKNIYDWASGKDISTARRNRRS